MKESPIEIITDNTKGAFRPLGSSIEEAHMGLRVDAYLSNYFPFLSRSAWQKRIRNGSVQINQKTVRAGSKLQKGDVISMFHPQSAEPEVDRGIYPIWKKGAVMAVYKPGNLPMHENGPYRYNTFSAIAQKELGPEWAAVHRLDRETSGIVLCGATASVRQELSRSLAHRTLDKSYLMVARGTTNRPQWLSDGAIGDDTSSPIRIKKWVVPEGGQYAQTYFEVLACSQGYSLLHAKPRTGRTNQIRIHAAYENLPLVGDRLYHPDESVFLEWFEQGMTERVINSVGFNRCLLHAWSLTFVHPEDGKLAHIKCPIPEDMSEFWHRVGGSSLEELRQ